MQGRDKRVYAFSFVFILLIASVAFGAKYNQVVDVGSPMPRFDSLPAVDGTKLSSDSLKEDVVVLVFLANHCPWVRGMDGDLVKLVDQFKGRSVRIVGVSVSHLEEDKLPGMKIHAAKAGYNFTYVYDESQELGRELGAAHTPEYFVFNKARKLVYMGLLYDSPASMRSDGSINYTRGTPTRYYVKDAIEAALAGKPAPEPETRAQGCTIEYQKVN